MGICFSSAGRRRRNVDQEEDNWWNNKKALDSKLNSNGAEADELAQTPGRLIGDSASSIASLYTQQGKKGTNQDAMIVLENFSSRSDAVFCGVFDGHGPNGHVVAKRIRDSLPVLLSSQWKASSNSVSRNSGDCSDDNWCESLDDDENGKFPKTYQPLKQSVLKAFKLMDKELKFQSAIDCFCSGSTAVVLVKQGGDLIIGNVGDSRAVLATRGKNNALTAVQLTTDLKPSLPREAARIQQCKGRIFALQDEPEVARVWLPDSNAPGLAMARAFGDFCLKDFGLISVPDVYYHRLSGRDEFVVLATDGVWDVLSNKEAIDIVASAPTRATAARALVECAIRAWRLKYPTSKTDDCAVICLFLNQFPTANSTLSENNLTKVTENTLKKTSMRNADAVNSYIPFIEHSDTFKDNGEIVPVLESRERNVPQNYFGESKRSLAECISMGEDEEWSALEGITRVNSLLSLPRFSSGDKRAASGQTWS